MSEFSIRPGTSSDIEAAVSVWRESEAARRGGTPPEHEKRARKHIGNPDSFLLVAEDESSIVGVACGMPGLADDGAGPKVDGLCHIGMVFVAPERWGEGIGWMLVEATLEETRSRGYTRRRNYGRTMTMTGRRDYMRGMVSSGAGVRKKTTSTSGSSTTNVDCEEVSGWMVRESLRFVKS